MKSSINSEEACLETLRYTPILEYVDQKVVVVVFYTFHTYGNINKVGILSFSSG